MTPPLLLCLLARVSHDEVAFNITYQINLTTSVKFQYIQVSNQDQSVIHQVNIRLSHISSINLSHRRGISTQLLISDFSYIVISSQRELSLQAYSTGCLQVQPQGMFVGSSCIPYIEMSPYFI